MIKLTFPDGSIKEYKKGIKVVEVIESISISLKKKCLAGKLNDTLLNLEDEIYEDGNILFITPDSKEAFEILNHSTAHLLAHAVSELYPHAQMGVGPAIEEGFYYDFDLGDTKLNPNDLAKIEKKMNEIINRDLKIEHSIVSKEDAKKLMSNDKYKLELIDAIEGDTVNVYKQGEYYEVCRGPHVPSTRRIKFFKLLNIAGSYWRGDSKNKMLTRIYGTSWFTNEALNEYLDIVEKRKLRDHRKIGKELELYMISEFGPGLPFWLPNGYALRRSLEDMWIEKHRKNGYVVINTPIMLSKELWEISGHWDHYKEDMFITSADESEYAIKPMNCPGAILVYKNSLHSYKELPLRYAELGHVHRNEASGALNGLFRVRTFTQDDAHILLRKDQIGDEITNILKLYDEVYSLFGLDYNIELSTRPEENYIGDIEVWNEAEEKLKEACLATGHNFKINPGDGAFYGPKLDFKLKDSMNRIWQCGTIQLDMQLPGRFNCTYIDENGNKETPIMIHRACFGSLERFIGIITENYAGAFPTWLAPIQVNLLPVGNVEKQNEYALKLKSLFEEHGVRVKVDAREEKLSYRLRESQLMKIPYTLVLGDKEVDENTITYRKFGTTQQVNMPISEFLEKIYLEIKNLGK